MKIGRNDACPCGSGKKYKKCCLGASGSRIQAISWKINMAAFPPRVEGLDDWPDLKVRVERAICRHMLDDNFSADLVIHAEMRSYNELMDEVNRALPKPYGMLLQDIRSLNEQGKHDDAIALADSVLQAYPDSIETSTLKGRALLALNKHPLQQFFSQIIDADKLAGRKLLAEFGEEFKKSGVPVRDAVFVMIHSLYEKGKIWRQRYAALDMIKAIGFNELGSESIARLDALILNALRDEDGRVRNNAFYCVEYTKLRTDRVKFFSSLLEQAGMEADKAKQRSLCRALLGMVCPATYHSMSATGQSQQYNEAVEFALKITGRADDRGV